MRQQHLGLLEELYQARFRAMLKRIPRERSAKTGRMSDGEWHVYLQNRARLAGLVERRRQSL